MVSGKAIWLDGATRLAVAVLAFNPKVGQFIREVLLLTDANFGGMQLLHLEACRNTESPRALCVKIQNTASFCYAGQT